MKHLQLASLTVCLLPMALAGCSCAASARAEALADDTTANEGSLEAALEARSALVAGRGVARLAGGEAAACADGEVAWDRGAKLGVVCASPCRDDSGCARGERCTILSPSPVADEKPRFAVDEPDLFLEADALAAASVKEPVFDAAPLCDDACREYTGDLEIHPQRPLAFCDAFAEEG